MILNGESTGPPFVSRFVTASPRETSARREASSPRIPGSKLIDAWSEVGGPSTTVQLTNERRNNRTDDRRQFRPIDRRRIFLILPETRCELAIASLTIAARNPVIALRYRWSIRAAARSKLTGEISIPFVRERKEIELKVQTIRR